MTDALARLRKEARARTLLPPTTLAAALQRIGFIQADPIRAPARAQDLILRHRVRAYRAGDLDRAFARLGLEEDFLYAYGFMPRPVRDLLHPRLDAADPDAPALHVPAGLAAEVLAFVRDRKLTHPRDLEARFGAERAENNWGGFSKATTRALETLRHYGLLRVARRRDGIRIYAAAPPSTAAPGPDPAERARRLVLLVAAIMAPLPATGGALALIAHRNPGLGKLAPTLRHLLATGELEREVIDGLAYLRPAGPAPDHIPARDVRILAPFDPLVWDRRRFQHLWGWEYRFEAYTPPPKRRLGYYAMPLLWGDAVIGWANASVQSGRLHATIGYATREPRSQLYRRALDAELARLERFLNLPPPGANTNP